MIVGLLTTLIGSCFLCFGLIISKEKAVELGKSYPSMGGSGNNSLGFERYKNQPPVEDRWRQSQNAKIGIIFIFIGSIFQLIATVLNSDSKQNKCTRTKIILIHQKTIGQIKRNKLRRKKCNQSKYGL